MSRILNPVTSLSPFTPWAWLSTGVKVVVGSGLLLVVTILHVYLAAWIWLRSQPVPPPPQPADTIIVLGTSVYYRGKYNPCLRSRVEQGAALYRAGLAHRIIVTGGNDLPTGPNEAEVMQDILLGLGIPIEHIWLEPKATSTYENILFSQALMAKNQTYTAILVTDTYHTPRASLVAQQAHLTHTMSPATTSPCSATQSIRSSFTKREILALLWYWWQGWIK